MKYIFTLSIIFLFFNCSKKEDNVLLEAKIDEEVVTSVQSDNPSPCNSILTDNRVECSPNIFPNSTVPLTSVLTNSTKIDGIVPGFPQGGDIDIRFGNSIAPGVYTLVDNSVPSAGQASISITPISCSICPFKATSGNLYITETSTQWIAEWCSINFNAMTVTSSSTVSGRMITNK